MSVQTVWGNCIRTLSALLMSAGLSGSLLAQGLPHVQPEEVGMSSARLAMLDSTLRHYVDSGHLPGFVAGIARHGKIVYLQSAGWQDIERQQAMRDDAMFQIRSMSKPIASLAVMQLVEQGRLSLTDTVSQYIPSFANMEVFDDASDFNNSTRKADREITIGDLLLHIGGLSHRDRPLYQSRQVRSRADTLEQLVEKVAAVPLIAEPGTQWNYSISTTVLGRVVEIVSGQEFDDYLHQHVLVPLQMPDTGFYVQPGKLSQLTQIYRIVNGALQRESDMEVPITVDPALKEGAAGMVSTVPDYLRFLQAILNGGELDGARVLRAANVQQMIQNQLPSQVLPISLNPPAPMSDLGWGYGFSVVIDGSKSGFMRNNGEFGWNGSLGTFSWADPSTGLSAVLMLQVQPSGAFNLSSLFKVLAWQAIVD
ncbi:MAG: serine hydrolase domain-containing protein [Pseudohongiella sp.]|nr:serine hydrolase domain-containing protein [Pseudohongiella sp.]